MANGVNGNNIKKFFNVQTISTAIVLGFLIFFATTILSNRDVSADNTKTNHTQEADICENKSDIRSLKDVDTELRATDARHETEIAVLKANQQNILTNTNEMKEMLKEISKKIK